mgnify:CR=1 FL=1
MSEREQIIKSMEETRKQMAILSDLLTKDQERLEAVQEAGSWKPKDGESYWYINIDGKATKTRCLRTYIDQDLINAGNCFQTELEAKRHAAKMKFMFRRCPEIGEDETYYAVGYIGCDASANVQPYINTNHKILIARAHWVFKEEREAEEWLPLYKFAFLGGDCPEVF